MNSTKFSVAQIVGKDLVRNVAELKVEETRQRFLAEASLLLAASLDQQTTLQNITHLSVPLLADYCLVDLLDEKAHVQRAAAFHADPAKEALMSELLRFTPDPNNDGLLMEVLGGGQSRLLPELDDGVARTAEVGDARIGLVRALVPRSSMIVPLIAHSRVLGALTLVMADSDRPYGLDDLALAEELARRAALALDNARVYREALQAVQSRDRLLGIVSHDLRNPLNIISLGATVLLEPSLTPSSRAGQLRIIQRSVERMNRLVQDLLDVARIEVGTLSLHLEGHEAGDLLGEAFESHRALTSDKCVELECHIQRKLGPVRADRDRILQIFSNLIGNALRFTPPGGRIELGAEEAPGGHVRFSVTDMGPGIPREQFPRLFDAFWQGCSNGREGAGLGLAIVSGIVEAHGGHLEVDSTVGVGSRFSFTLPGAGQESMSSTEGMRLAS